MIEIIKPFSYENILSIRKDIAVCPYCKSALYVTAIPAMAEDATGWMAEEIQLDCGGEPYLDSEEWGEWLKVHTDMPYVHWLPVENKVIDWINSHYRFIDV